MSKFRMLLFAVVGILASSMSVFAQAAAEAGDNASSVSKYQRTGGGYRFRDRGFWRRDRTVAHRRVRRAKARRVIPAQPDVFRR